MGFTTKGRAIGIATVVDFMRMNGSEARASTDVFEGAILQAVTNPVQIYLMSGNRFDLAANSAAQIFENKVSLVNGSAQFHAISSSFTIVNNSLHIIVDRSSVVRIQCETADVKIVVVKGRTQISNSDGLPVAVITSGSARELRLEANGPSESQITGRLTRSGAGIYLTDLITNFNVEVQGPNLTLAAGDCIEADGWIHPSFESVFPLILQITSYKPSKCEKWPPRSAVLDDIRIQIISSDTVKGPFTGGKSKQIGV